MAQLLPPIITATVIDRVTIRISGLSVEHASAYQLRWGTLSGGGRVDTIQADSEGSFLLSDCRARTTYFLSARALGDDESYENSNWSTEISVVTGQIVDTSINAPVITLGTIGYTWLLVNGLQLDRSYRYQISTDPDTLADQPPKVIGAGTSTSGNGRILGLRPNTTYYVRFCSTHPRGRCSLWSDTLSFTIPAPTATIVVTNANDSGEGSLRAAISSAVTGNLITFAPELDGKTIALESSISSNQTITIDASTLPNGLTIDFGSVAGRTMSTAAASWIGFTFKNQLVSTNNVHGFNGGFYSDCVWENCSLTANYAIVYNGSVSRSKFIGCNSTGSTVSQTWIADTILDGCSGGLMYQSSAANVVVVNSYVRYAFSQGRSSNCTVANNSGNTSGLALNSGNSYECDVVGNQLEMAGNNNTGPVCSGNLYDCRVAHNISNGSYAPAYYNGSGYCYDCVFEDNLAKQNRGVGQGRYYRCKVIEPLGTMGCTYSTLYAYDSLFTATAAGTFVNCTAVKSTSTNASNCLFGSGSTGPTTGSSNFFFDVNNPETPYHKSKVFIDPENGDYRLRIDSPAIAAGDVELISDGGIDLAGNPRLTNNTVACGCYEFAAYQLDPPTFSVSIQQGGQVNIAYTLPDYADGFSLQYASNASFTNAHEVSSTATSFDLTGLSGNVWIRAKATGISGKTLDSVWTTPQQVYVDTLAPVVTVDQTPIVMVYGDDIDFLAGVSVVDDSGTQCTVKYRLWDSDGPVVVDGEVFDIPSARIPKGRYELEIDATDALGNAGYALRGLTVLPPKIPTPTITLKSINGGTVVISGLLDSAATGWTISVDGVESDAVVNSGGQTTITALGDGTHIIKARAKGDYFDPDPPEQPTGDYRDSDWSNTLSITIGGDAPVGVPTIRKTAITDHTVTLVVDGLSDDLGYLEFYIATKFDFSDALVVTKLPQSTVTITGLKAATIYFVKARGVYATDKTDYSPWIAVETAELQATSPADKLIYIRSRIQLLRDYLAELGNLSSVSIDGISETQVDRAAIRAELAELEAEESRLMNGGGRLRTIDARWVI